MEKSIQEQKEEKRVELINDLAATATVMDELWRYHPGYPNKVDIVKEYSSLQKMQSDIEQEIKDLAL